MKSPWNSLTKHNPKSDLSNVKILVWSFPPKKGVRSSITVQQSSAWVRLFAKSGVENKICRTFRVGKKGVWSFRGGIYSCFLGSDSSLYGSFVLSGREVGNARRMK